MVEGIVAFLKDLKIPSYFDGTSVLKKMYSDRLTIFNKIVEHPPSVISDYELELIEYLKKGKIPTDFRALYHVDTQSATDDN